MQGIHCASCVIRIERKLKRIEGVQEVRVDALTGKTELFGPSIPPVERLHQAVQADGYAVRAWVEQPGARSGALQKQTLRDYLEMVLIGVLLLVLLLAFSRAPFLPKGTGISEHMSYGMVFVMGLIASVSSCAAATGSLLLGMTTAYNERRVVSSERNQLHPSLFFHVGRLLSYTCLGAVMGALGTMLTLSPLLNGAMTLVAALVMLLLGLQLLQLFPWVRRFQPRLPKRLAHQMYEVSEKQSPLTFFLVGAATFFLPCGFTQALQLYVLSQGGMLTGALTMLTFALGTFPALLSLGAVSSFIKGPLQRYVVKVSGVLMLLIGLLNISSGLAIAGVPLPFATPAWPSNRAHVTQNQVAPIINGKQRVSMKVVGFEYIPSVFTVVAGMPVEWQVDGTRAEGCANVLTVPDLGITVALPTQGSKTIVFVPQQSGTLAIRCPMAMTTAGARFIVLPKQQTTTRLLPLFIVRR
ncbi:MAG: sulfite exporter TauE/SafE family protein [Ktedonobacteraceae bacterium]|nr:sulfite exporter TauE/SafE family protein [Ktedonobacteraceae bacterium]